MLINSRLQEWRLKILRGVKTERPIHTLSARGLVQEVGRAEGTGELFYMVQQKNFFNYFGLKDIHALPPLPEGSASR